MSTSSNHDEYVSSLPAAIRDLGRLNTQAVLIHWIKQDPTARAVVQNMGRQLSQGLGGAAPSTTSQRVRQHITHISEPEIVCNYL